MAKISAHVKQYDTKIYYVEKEKLEQVSGKNAHQVHFVEKSFVSFVTYFVGDRI